MAGSRRWTMTIAHYDAVTVEDILRLARKTLDYSQLSLSAVGPVGDGNRNREIVASEL
jgi:predicted Zn-dependent peptidase